MNYLKFIERLIDFAEKAPKTRIAMATLLFLSIGWILTVLTLPIILAS